MAEIVLKNVTKRWGQFYGVDNLNLVIKDNAFVTLLGPSGCGKTTTLRMIAGLETPTAGRITINGVPVFDSEQGINIPANKRSVGFLFQNYALWPNMTVYQNISFGLSNVKEEMIDIDSEARMFAKLLETLKKPKEVAALIKECRDKSGKLDTEKTKLYLIDVYEISGFGAKALMEYKLHEVADVERTAADISRRLNEKLNAVLAKHAQTGRSLNENFEFVKNGAVQKSIRKLSKEEIDLIVRRVSRIVKIGMFMDRYPSELSGGQQQRVAIARTLAPDPKVLFMDEPLSNLDAKLRLEMRSELQRLHIRTGSTFVYVTHDQLEAMTLATEICLIDNGVLQQYDEPLTVYNKPNNLFVADFVGNPAINFINANGAHAEDGKIELTVWDGVKAEFTPTEPVNIMKWRAEEKEKALKEQAAEQAAHKGVEKSNKNSVFKPHIAITDEDVFGENAEPSGDGFVIGVRPEFIRIESSPSREINQGSTIVEGEIFSAMPTGMETTVKIRIGKYLLTGVVFGGILYRIGQKVRIGFRGDGIMLFDRRNGRMITGGSLNFIS